MALDKNDIQMIAGLLDEKLGEVLDRKLDEKLAPINQALALRPERDEVSMFIQAQTDPLKNQITDLSKKVDKLSENMAKGFDDLYKRDEARDQEFAAMEHQIKRLDKKCA